MDKDRPANIQNDRDEIARELYSLLIMISTPKKVEEMANYALANGAVGAFFSYARGTLPNHLLSVLGLANVKREIAALAVPNSMATSLLDNINRQFNLAEKLGGIAYLISLEKTTAGIDDEQEYKYSMIATIVNEGEGEDVIEHVRRNYHVGASILQALGSVKHSKKTFDFEIVPSKEIVLIITRKNLCEAIYRTIHDSLRTELPGRGVIFSTNIDKVAGIFEKNRETEKMIAEDDSKLTDSEPCETNSELLPEPTVNETAEHDKTHQIAVLALVDRGHTGDIVRLAETVGSRGATIMRGRFTEHESRGFLSQTGDIGKEAVIMVANKETALAILRQLRLYAATHTDEHILLTWMRIHSFSRFSYGKE
jgi:nitrogen regulatory protein PII